MRVKRRKTMALLAAVSIVCAQSTVSDVFAAGAEEVAAQENNAVSIEYLTLQPGERDDSVNLNWYAPEGTQNAIVRMGDKTVEAWNTSKYNSYRQTDRQTDGRTELSLTEQSIIQGNEMSQTVSKQDMMQGSRTLVQTEPWLLNNENIGRKTDTATCLLARDYKGYGKMQLGNGVVEQWRKS